MKSILVQLSARGGYTVREEKVDVDQITIHLDLHIKGVTLNDEVTYRRLKERLSKYINDFNCSIHLAISDLAEHNTQDANKLIHYFETWGIHIETISYAESCQVVLDGTMFEEELPLRIGDLNEQELGYEFDQFLASTDDEKSHPDSDSRSDSNKSPFDFNEIHSPLVSNSIFSSNNPWEQTIIDREFVQAHDNGAPLAIDVNPLPPFNDGNYENSCSPYHYSGDVEPFFSRALSNSQMHDDDDGLSLDVDSFFNKNW